LENSDYITFVFITIRIVQFLSQNHGCFLYAAEDIEFALKAFKPVEKVTNSFEVPAITKM